MLLAIQNILSKRKSRKLADNFNSACDLTMELFPFYYTPIVRSAYFRIAFSSLCFNKRDLTFELYFNEEDKVNILNHPNLVELDIFGNIYQI